MLHPVRNNRVKKNLLSVSKDLNKQPESLTIGQLARAADVGVETIRYYQRLALLPIPQPTIERGAFRHYPLDLVNRIRFIKRSQDLGFSLKEISSLLALEDGTNRRAIRKITTARLADIQRRLDDLARMRETLLHLVHQCEITGHAKPCPIIAALASDHAQTAARGDQLE